MNKYYKYIYFVTVALALAAGYLLKSYELARNPPTLTITYQCVHWQTTEW